MKEDSYSLWQMIVVVFALMIMSAGAMWFYLTWKGDIFNIPPGWEITVIFDCEGRAVSVPLPQDWKKGPYAEKYEGTPFYIGDEEDVPKDSIEKRLDEFQRDLEYLKQQQHVF